MKFCEALCNEESLNAALKILLHFLTTKGTKDFDALLKLTSVRIKEHNSFKIFDFYAFGNLNYSKISFIIIFCAFCG
jgi:hypothetical protein